MHTGRRVGLTRALLRVLVMRAARLAARPLSARGRQRYTGGRERQRTAADEGRELGAKLHAIEMEHEGDPDALQRALADFYAQHAELGQGLHVTGRYATVAKRLVVFVLLNRVLTRLRDALTGRVLVVAERDRE